MWMAEKDGKMVDFPLVIKHTLCCLIYVLGMEAVMQLNQWKEANKLDLKVVSINVLYHAIIILLGGNQFMEAILS